MKYEYTILITWNENVHNYNWYWILIWWWMDKTDFSKLISRTQNISKAFDDRGFLCAQHDCWQHTLYLDWVKIPIKLTDCIFDFLNSIAESLAKSKGYTWKRNECLMKRMLIYIEIKMKIKTHLAQFTNK